MVRASSTSHPNLRDWGVPVHRPIAQRRARSCPREFAPRILVNAVAPGPTDTPLLHFDTLSPAVQALELSNPLGRIGRPQEIAAMILFLAGPGASFMTGQCIGV